MAAQYEMMELTFQGPAPEGSESLVDVTADFTRTDPEGHEQTKRVFGFYAGQNTYHVRFLPEEPGTYRYCVRGLVQEEGRIDIAPAAEGHHGPVRAAGTSLRHADGTWFYGFGTTVYALAHQDEALTEETFATLKESPFNKIRLCVFPKHYVYNYNEPDHFTLHRKAGETLTFMDNLGQTRTVEPFDGHHPCFEFWDEFEEKLERLFAMGMQVDLILFHPYDRWGHSHMTMDDNLAYAEYALRRLAAYPNIWWSMANEYDLFFDWEKEDWYTLDEYISAHDPYHHLLSNHNCFIPYDFERPAVTHVSLQHRTMILTEEMMERFGKPVLYDECCYEGNLPETWGSISAEEMVRRFWQVTVMGGHCTHGEVLLDPEDDEQNAVLWWAKGGRLKGESPERIGFLRSVIESLPCPLKPWHPGFGDLAKLPEEQVEEIIAGAPGNLGDFLRRMMEMDSREQLFHKMAEYEFQGHAGDGVYLFYFDRNCFARFRPNLPGDKNYRIELIDTWNMTRETIAEHYQPGTLLKLPGREFMAILATAED